MKKPQRRGPSPSVPIDTLAARGAEALQQERLKEAVELFKLVIRQEPRPEWKESLNEAYAGRARALAAKGMFKEAAMVLENTVAPDGTLREPLLYLKCLIREGQQPQQQKAAAHALLYAGNGRALPTTERTALEELAAALLVAVPQRPEPAGAAPGGRAQWLELAQAAREALAAWVNGAMGEEIDRLLNRISLRSAFRPLRLLLKTLTGGTQDAGRTKRLLETIPPGSPFFPLRQAVEAAVVGERVLDADGWARLTPPQQAFVAETRGLPAEAAQFLARSSEAARRGPGALFAFLLQQSGLPQADVRSACLNLLPQIPDRVQQFEKSFGPLSKVEQHRVQALAAEARGDWEKAERSWRAVAAAIAGEGGAQAKLSQGAIFRHLAKLAAEHPEIEGDGVADDTAVFYLERSREADPEHIPTVLELIGLYRKEFQDSDWHRVVDDAVQRFPDDSQVLLQATESAVARNAYKKAAGFARRLLKIDPINAAVRRQMIELQVAHARKQVRAKRPDLAAKELAGAAEWDRPDAPSAVLRIARGLVARQTGQEEQGEAWLREGVALAGGGVAGWFRAVLEAELMKSPGSARLRKELAHARETPPTKEAVMAIVAVLGQPEAAGNRKAVSGVLPGMYAWLLQAADFAWSAAEFETLAGALVRFEAFDLLQDYARAARRRDPADPALRFHQIVARSEGDADRLSMVETNDLEQLADAAADRQDFHTANRIRRFAFGNADAPFGRRRRGRPADLPDGFDIDDMDPDELLESMMDQMAGRAGDELRRLARDLGREGAVEHMIEEFRSGPLGRSMPRPMLRELCETVIAAALDDGRRGQGTAARSIPV